MSRALALGVFAALLVWSDSAHAIEVPTSGQPVRVNLTSTTIAAWHANNGNDTGCDDNYGEALERFNVNASWETFVVGLRLDGSFYYPRPEPTAPAVLERRCLSSELSRRYLNSSWGALVPEKMWATWMGRTAEVTVGDTYVSFGRGLTLSLRKSDELGLDTTQRGLRARLLTERFNGTLVAGVININNIDESSGRYEPDPGDAVVGATADVRVFGDVRLGANASTFLFKEPVSTSVPPGVDQSFQEKWLLAGPKIDARFGAVTLYLEGMAQHRMPVSGDATTGYGAYGSLTARAGPATVLVEAKAYGDLEVVQPDFKSLEFQPVQYTAPPTLERVLQPLEHTQREIAGGRSRVDYSLNPDVAVYANYGLFRDWNDYLLVDVFYPMPGTIHDPYAGLDARFGDYRIHAEAGYRFVMVRGDAIRRDGHVDFDIIRALPGGSSLEFHVIHLERGETLPFVGELDWREGTVQLGYRNRPKYAVSATLDYTTEPNQPSFLYPGGTVEYDFTESSNLRLFAGASRGGLRCVSGVCRIFPPFAGAKATLTLRY